MSEQKKRFFTQHAKSSAMVVSLVVHLILLVVAASFVAVSVVMKNENQFEAPHVNRPKMPVKRLQVPVKMQKKRPKPKLRKQITVKSRMNQKMPDIKMPEIVGIKGGLGATAGSSISSVAGVGFSMPEIDVFGVKSKGEKVFLILDSREYIMYDEVGGLAGYTLIKKELTRIIDSLPPTTLFNIAVFDTGGAKVLFKSMVPANQANVEKIAKWLAPLNAVSKHMTTDQYGLKTLGKGGYKITEDFRHGKIEKNRAWYPAACEAMKEQADSVFLLASIFGYQVNWGKRVPLSKSAQRKYDECFKKAQKLLDEDNKKRLAKGEPPRVINRNSKWEMNKAYFPDIEFPHSEGDYWYTSKDFKEAFYVVRKKYASKTGSLSAGLGKKKKNDKFSFNIVQFVPDGDAGEFQYRYDRSIPKFQDLAHRLHGQYRTIKGMKGIKSAVSH